MAYEYDRFEREEGGGSFLMGLLAGTVLGAGLGMLFAPKAGAELRSQLVDQTGKLREKADQSYQQATDKVSQIVDRGREAYDKAGIDGITWVIPEDEMSILVELGGVPTGFTHGHLFGKGSTPQQKALEWWKGQDFGFQAVRAVIMSLLHKESHA